MTTHPKWLRIWAKRKEVSDHTCALKDEDGPEKWEDRLARGDKPVPSPIIDWQLLYSDPYLDEEELNQEISKLRKPDASP